MSKIEVGMLVMIISDKQCSGPVGVNGNWAGHIGAVIRPCPVYSGGWDIEGAEIDIDGSLQSFLSSSLRIIRPPKAADEDFQEDLKNWLKTEVTA